MGSLKFFWQRCLFAAWIASLLILPVSARSGGMEAPDIHAGKKIAERSCARCHAIGRMGESSVGTAPAFRTLTQKWPLENLAEALAEGIVTGHPGMPVIFLSPSEIDNLLGWLESVQEK